MTSFITFPRVTVLPSCPRANSTLSRVKFELYTGCKILAGFLRALEPAPQDEGLGLLEDGALFAAALGAREGNELSELSRVPFPFTCGAALGLLGSLSSKLGNGSGAPMNRRRHCKMIVPVVSMKF